MNEGCATFVHHYIMNELYNKGLIGEGAMMEFMPLPFISGVPAGV